MDLHTLIGLAGVAGYVTSYLMLQLGFLDGNGARYSVANVLAAALVLVSLTDEFNLASALIQVIWIVIGVSGLALRMARTRSNAPLDPVLTEVPTDQHDAQVPAGRSPFRAAPGASVTGYDLVPDSARATGRPSLGLRADVLGAYQAARATNQTS